MDYIKHIVTTHYKLLNSSSQPERKRMALVGDGIWKGIAASCVAKKDIEAKEMGELMTGLISNKTMAKFFPREYITAYGDLSLNEHSLATFFEAAIYLEYSKYGFDYMQRKIHAGINF